MNKTFSYLPYAGINSFAYYGCIKDDIVVASKIADILVNKGFRLYLDARGDKKEASFVELSDSIIACQGAVVFLSKKSIESLSFRNIVNNIISIGKPVVFIKIGNFDLTYGLDMQLANCNIINYTNDNDTASALLDSNVLTQDMIGEGMIEASNNGKKIYIMLVMIMIALLIFVISALSIINKRTSAEYILKDVNNVEYLNIAKYGDEAIKVLSDKTISELDLSSGSFTSLDGIERINITTINVSDLSEEVSLDILYKIENLKTVKLSQNQIQYADELINKGIRVIITH